MKTVPCIRRMVLSSFLLFASGCLPDSADHSACKPDGETRAEPQIRLELDPAVPPELLAARRSGNLLLVEEDIAIASAAEDPLRSIVTTGRLWDLKQIRYRISPTLPSPSRVHEAVATWEKKTNGLIHFIELAEGEGGGLDYLEFIEGDGCWSYVGRMGGRQEISLAKDCNTRAATHEIGHALGLWHEQSRADRDQFVEVKWCNIQEGKLDNFRKKRTSARDFGPYDYASIMHYPSGAFTKNAKVTLQSITSTPVHAWSNRTVSAGDLNSILCLYQLEGCVR